MLKILANILILVLISIFLLGCQTNYSNLYLKNKFNFWSSADYLLYNYESLRKEQICYKDSELLTIYSNNDRCISKWPELNKDDFNLIFDKKLVYSVDLYSNYIFFNMKYRDNFFYTRVFFLVYAPDPGSIERLVNDNDFSVKQIDHDWYFVVFDYDE